MLARTYLLPPVALPVEHGLRFRFDASLGVFAVRDPLACFGHDQLRAA